MRSLIQWNPYQELNNWHRDIDDLFRRVLHGGANEDNQASTTSWLPTTEAFERDGQYVIRVDVPGINPNEIEASVVNDTLTLKGERKRCNEVKEKDYYFRETAYGRFERKIALPEGIDPDKVVAKFESGVLEIAMPLPQSAAAKKVPIQVTSSEPKQIKAA